MASITVGKLFTSLSDTISNNVGAHCIDTKVLIKLVDTRLNNGLSTHPNYKLLFTGTNRAVISSSAPNFKKGLAALSKSETLLNQDDLLDLIYNLILFSLY